jgi:hypothetical protein
MKRYLMRAILNRWCQRFQNSFRTFGEGQESIRVGLELCQLVGLDDRSFGPGVNL